MSYTKLNTFFVHRKECKDQCKCEYSVEMFFTVPRLTTLEIQKECSLSFPRGRFSLRDPCRFIMGQLNRVFICYGRFVPRYHTFPLNIHTYLDLYAPSCGFPSGLKITGGHMTTEKYFVW